MADSNKTLIDWRTPVPKYYQIQMLLQDRVESGQWLEGQAIPSERDLCAEFRVSRPTVRQALGNLVSSGFLRREQGKGTFVAWPKLVEGTLTARGRSTYQDWEKRGFNFSVRVLSMGVHTAPVYVQRELDLRTDELIVRIERLLCIENDIIRHVVSFLPLESCPGILDEDLSHQSLTALLRDKYSLVIKKADQRLQAQPPSALDIHLLGITERTPVFVLTSVNFNKKDRPIWVDVDRCRSDRVMFEVTTSENEMMKKKISALLRTECPRVNTSADRHPLKRKKHRSAAIGS